MLMRSVRRKPARWPRPVLTEGWRRPWPAAEPTIGPPCAPTACEHCEAVVVATLCDEHCPTERPDRPDRKDMTEGLRDGARLTLSALFMLVVCC